MCFLLQSGPDKVQSLIVKKSDDNPLHLDVTFKTPCSRNYEYGRPDEFEISVKQEDDCSRLFWDTGNAY